jgi:hypothetical protein
MEAAAKNAEKTADKMERIANDENRSESDRLRAAEISAERRDALEKGKGLRNKLKDW